MNGKKNIKILEYIEREEFVMFRKMKRISGLTTEEEAINVLETGLSGTLAVVGDDGYPYAIPLNYVYSDGKIYFHSARKGHKIDAITKNDKVCFSVVTKEDIMPSEFDTDFISAIAFGKARVLDEKNAVVSAMVKIGKKYSKGFEKEAVAYIEASWGEFIVVEITIEHVSGKKRS